MAKSVSEERSTFVGCLSDLCLFKIILCKGIMGYQWRCDENRRYSNELHGLINT